MTTKPRRWTGRLLLVADLVVANAVAGIWVATFLQPRVLGADPGPGGEAIEGRRSVLLPLDTPAAWLAFAGGVLLLVCNFAWLVRPRARGLPSHWVLSETAAGPVRVAREAIENALRVRGEALAEVTTCSPSCRCGSSASS